MAEEDIKFFQIRMIENWCNNRYLFVFIYFKVLLLKMRVRVIVYTKVSIYTESTPFASLFLDFIWHHFYNNGFF